VGGLDRVTPSQQHRILGMSALAFTACFAVSTICSIISIRIIRRSRAAQLSTCPLSTRRQHSDGAMESEAASCGSALRSRCNLSVAAAIVGR
jgi:hypothetical protein